MMISRCCHSNVFQVFEGKGELSLECGKCGAFCEAETDLKFCRKKASVRVHIPLGRDPGVRRTGRVASMKTTRLDARKGRGP